MDDRGELHAHVLGVQDGGDQLRYLFRRHRLDRNGLGEPRSLPDLDGARQGMGPVELVAPIGGKQHHPASDEPAGHVVEQVAGRAVGPVNVVENDEQPTLARPELEERDDRLEHAQLRLRWISHRRRLSAVAELRKQLPQLPGHLPELGAQEREVMLAELVPDRLDERQVRKRELHFRAAPPEHAAAELSRASCQLGGEARLADARLPGHEHEAPVAPVGGEERVLELGQLLLPTDEDR